MTIRGRYDARVRSRQATADPAASSSRGGTLAGGVAPLSSASGEPRVETRRGSPVRVERGAKNIPRALLPNAAAVLRTARRAADLSQADLARRALVSQATVARAEKGTGQVSAQVLYLLAERLGLSGPEFADRLKKARPCDACAGSGWMGVRC